MAKVLVVDDAAVDRHLVGSLLARGRDLVAVYAADGSEGLEVMRREQPDLVLTDLQMPQTDGLELVGQIRSLSPLTPVILMTGQGSEEIAVQALKRGAASYVPKRLLASDLVKTVERVLLLAQARRRQQRLQERVTQTETHFALENDPALIPPLVSQLSDNLTRMRLCDEAGLIRVIVAVSEAVENAMHHGNLEADAALRDQDEDAYSRCLEERRRQWPYRGRKVYVVARETCAQAVYIVRDEGAGFDVAAHMNTADGSSLDGGRGLLLIRTFMDEVYFNEAGNQITMIKRRDIINKDEG
jgi:CheY-like chemotaxis protein/anti-sigma regulatory factor (Ser/Thr protein kinase)